MLFQIVLGYIAAILDTPVFLRSPKRLSLVPSRKRAVKNNTPACCFLVGWSGVEQFVGS